MITALAVLSAALWLAQVAIVARIPAPPCAPPPPVAPPPDIEAAALADLLDAPARRDLAQLVDAHPDLSAGEILRRCLRVQARAERGEA